MSENSKPNTVSLRALARQGGPKGERLAGYAGPGTLCPGVGKKVQRTGQPQYCGAMAGIAMAVTKSPNPRDPSRMSTRFVGDCIAITYDGQTLQVTEFFLPGTATRALEAALGLSGEGVRFSFEIWCEPDGEGRPPSPLGYSYVTYNRRTRPANDPVLALAYETGLIEPPAGDGDTLLLAANEAQVNADDVDPETGEVIGRSDPVENASQSAPIGENAPQSVKSTSGKTTAKRA